MATEQSSAAVTTSGSLAKSASWLAGLIGLWTVVSPFVLTGAVTTGVPMWSNVVAGIAIVVLAAFGAYAVRSTAEMVEPAGEWSGWIAALAGLWILVSPFVLGGEIAASPVKWSNVVAGVVVFLLAAYSGYTLHSGG